MNKQYAFISDIHGNSSALTEVLKDIAKRDITTIYNLGDSLFGPLDPHGTFEILKNHNITHLMGNGDRELLLPDDGSPTTINDNRRMLTLEEKNWLSSLPSTIQTEHFWLFHGSPRSDEEYLLENLDSSGTYHKPLDELKKMLPDNTPPVIVCGHSHLPRIVQITEGPLVVNTGSVGLPAYKDELPFVHKMESMSPDAKYVILEKNNYGWAAQIIHVPYDYKPMADLARSQNRPDWVHALETGFALD